MMANRFGRDWEKQERFLFKTLGLTPHTRQFSRPPLVSFLPRFFLHRSPIRPSGLFEAALAIRLFSNVEWNIPVLDHMSDLALHRERKQDTEVNEQDWPKDRDIKDTEKSASECNHYRLCCRMPNTKNKRKKKRKEKKSKFRA